MVTLRDRISISYAIDLWSRYANAFPIPDFLTIPVLTESLIVETTALDCFPPSPHLPHFSYFHPYSLFLSLKLPIFFLSIKLGL
ncbi:MAG: hypothetical protein F6K26_44975 [Moorea sp. SIO2I5]|nr:hypothetical protein [Moorena sp. SIO2I5]